MFFLLTKVFSFVPPLMFSVLLAVLENIDLVLVSLNGGEWS